MPDTHAALLINVAPRVAEIFRTDPEMARLSAPAVLVEAKGEECLATILEQSELVDLLSSGTLEEGTSIHDVTHEDGLISVLVIEGDSASHYRVPDPRSHPKVWPWMGDPEY